MHNSVAHQAFWYCTMRKIITCSFNTYIDDTSYYGTSCHEFTVKDLKLQSLIILLLFDNLPQTTSTNIEESASHPSLLCKEATSYIRINGRPMAQGSALTRNVNIPHGSKNWLQRVILYRHKRYKCVREDCRPYQGETIYAFGMVIWWYLWINVFVWPLVFCEPRYGQSASMDCSGVI